MRQLLIFVLLSILMLSWYQYQDLDKINIQNITDKHSKKYIYISAKENDSVFIKIVDNNGFVKFRYLLDQAKAPMEIRPINNQEHLVLAGSYPDKGFYSFDKLLNVVDTARLNKEDLDVHDFDLLPNNHRLLLATYHQQHASNGINIKTQHDTINVQHYKIIEVDDNNQLVHIWDSQTHFAIEDAAHHVNTSLAQIDYCHINAIQYIAYDKTVLISSRNMDEVTKISWPKGDIIWRLGGRCNQFSFVNDSIGFSAQHQARLLGDTLLLFDNGAYHTTPRSSIVMYRINEQQKRIQLLKRFYGDAFNFSERRGGVQKLHNGNYLVCWAANKNYQYSELDKDGNTVQKGFFDTPINYRLNKGTWTPQLLQIVQQDRRKKQEISIGLQNISKYDLSLKKLHLPEGVVLEKDIHFPQYLPANKRIHFIIKKAKGKWKKSNQINFSINYTHKNIFFVNQDLQIPL